MKQIPNPMTRQEIFERVDGARESDRARNVERDFRLECSHGGQ